MFTFSWTAGSSLHGISSSCLSQNTHTSTVYEKYIIYNLVMFSGVIKSTCKLNLQLPVLKWIFWAVSDTKIFYHS